LSGLPGTPRLASTGRLRGGPGTRPSPPGGWRWGSQTSGAGASSPAATASCAASLPETTLPASTPWSRPTTSSTASRPLRSRLLRLPRERHHRGHVCAGRWGRCIRFVPPPLLPPLRPVRRPLLAW
jgi:hypothetical protein